ncbi:MAG: polysaccharide biosynthesis protein [Solirubrobacterales bacterium]
MTGGTGSFGQVLVRRLLEGSAGLPEEIVVFSRSEATQHSMRLAFQERQVATDEIVYEENRHHRLKFHIGDVSNYAAVSAVLRKADVVFHAAALKQVPTAEYHPFEAVRTNIVGAENIIQAIREHDLPVETVVGVSTDKACKPVNVMGMTKAIQERILAQGALDMPDTRFLLARYGNVLASRGSVIPVFNQQIRAGGPLTITTPEMTRFLLSLDRAVDIVFAAIADGRSGETYIPHVPSARMVDVAAALIGDREIEIEYTGIRPGEKIHEVLVSEEEASRTQVRGEYLAIEPILPELRPDDPPGEPFEGREYSSADDVIELPAVVAMMKEHGLMPDDAPVTIK